MDTQTSNILKLVELREQLAESKAIIKELRDVVRSQQGIIDKLLSIQVPQNDDNGTTQ